MSNYGYNYGELEVYAEEKRLNQGQEFAKMKEVFALVRVEDEFFLTKNHNTYEPYVTDETYLTKKIGIAFDKRNEIEKQYKNLVLKVERVFITKELWETL